MQEWMRILELGNWRVRSLLLVPLGQKSILNNKPVLVVRVHTLEWVAFAVLIYF
jgi:hypothetical protein